MDRYQKAQTLSARQLAVEKNDHWLFQDVGFCVEPGEMLHICGANGSGKTTLLRVLCGLTRADAGEVYWGERRIGQGRDEYHNQLSYVGHHDGIKPELSVQENLAIASLLAQDKRYREHHPELENVLSQVGLAKKKYALARTLSAGQKRRLALARCLLNDTAIWVLDEPLTSLDVHGIKLIETLLAQHLQRGGLALVTSHQPLNIQGQAHKELALC